MPDFKDMKTLMNYVQKKVDLSLQNEVFKAVRDVEIEHIESDVYAEYPNPIDYERRKDDGGLTDLDNYECVVNNGTMYMTNTTNSNDEYGTEKENLIGLIEYGDNRGYGRYDFPEEEKKRKNKRYKYLKPRPFIQNTREDLEENKQHLFALKKGLNKFKIKTI